MLSEPQPQPGSRFGRLVAQREIGSRLGWRTLWVCRCDCGNEHVVSERDLRSRNTKSCGCFSRLNRRNFIDRVIVTRTEEYLSLLDALESVLTRFPTAPREIRAALLEQWGPCDDRRFWRALRTLVEQGRATHHGKTRSTDTAYARAIPWSRNLANCIAEAAATFAVFELGMRRAA